MKKTIAALLIALATVTAQAGGGQQITKAQMEKAQYNWRTTIASNDLLDPDFEISDEYRLILLRREFAGMQYSLEQQQQMIGALLRDQAPVTATQVDAVVHNNPFATMSDEAVEELNAKTIALINSISLIRDTTTDDDTKTSLTNLIESLNLELEYFMEITGNGAPEQPTGN